MSDEPPETGSLTAHSSSLTALFGTADGISDRSAGTHHVAVGENVGVVHDVIDVHFGADKGVAEEVVAKSAAYVHQKVIVAGVAGVEDLATGSGLESVEAGRLPADTGHQIGANFFGDARLIDAVEIKQDWTIELACAVQALLGSPVRFEIESHPLVENYVAADGGVQAALFGADATRCKGRDASRCVIRPGRQGRAKADHGVGLLRRREAGDQQNRKNGREEGKLSQRNLLYWWLQAVRCRRQNVWMQGYG